MSFRFKMVLAHCLLPWLSCILVSVQMVAVAEPALAEDCAPPSWVKLIELRKKPDELVAAAFGANPAEAYIAAKRQIADRFVDQYGNELMRLPLLKGKLNSKIYGKEEILAAMKPAVSYNIKVPKRLEYEVKCSKVFIALLVQRKELISHLRQEEDFANHINAAMTGKLDKLEVAAFERINQSNPNELSIAESFFTNLSDVTKTLDPTDFLEKDMLSLLRQRGLSVKKAVDNARSLTFKDEREREMTRVKSTLAEAGKITTAVRDFKNREYISAIEIFQKCAREGDVNCQFISGIMTLRAMGVKKNIPESLKLLKRAASADHTIAKLFFGIYTFAGVGTKSDPELAAKWVNESFQQGWTCDIEIKSCAKEK